MNLLTREQFREQVFARDSNKCVICGSPAVDPHHILDRSLWSDGGYYLENGASLCEECHLKAEKTLLSCKDLWCATLGNKESYPIPEHFFADQTYDHWGNIIVPGGRYIRGELFYKENVQKILKEAGVLDLFIPYVKFPRTYHFPWSPNLQNDDRQHEDVDFFKGKEVVATEKMDGENTTLYHDYSHARSTDSRNHESRNWVKRLHGQIAHDIPEGWRVCGENLFAKHAIHYHHLPETYFMVFSIWNDVNLSLSWDDTVMYSNLLGLKMVPEIYRGPWDKDAIHSSFLAHSKASKDDVEGYVVRTTNSF
ncbi:MAG: hypothetical protein D4S01_09695, partial [Dehalococcoidia bacterium]